MVEIKGDEKNTVLVMECQPGRNPVTALSPTVPSKIPYVEPDVKEFSPQKARGAVLSTLYTVLNVFSC